MARFSTGLPAMAVLLSAAGLGGCIQTTTYGTGESPEIAIFSEMMGGLGKRDEEPIEYQPRAPLVMPPAAAQAGTQPLPAPVDVASNSDAAWPVEDTGPAGPRWGDNNPVDDVNSAEYRRLRPLAELSAGHTPGRNIVINDETGPQYDVLNRQQRETFRAAVEEVEGIPRERRFLTDPPDSYREPAPTAPTEFEDIDEEDKGGFFLTRWLRSD